MGGRFSSKRKYESVYEDENCYGVIVSNKDQNKSEEDYYSYKNVVIDGIKYEGEFSRDLLNGRGLITGSGSVIGK